VKTIGHITARVDGIALATGKPVFADDIKLSHLLHVKLLHSPIAHGRIKRIDRSKAMAIPGVVCILTHEDFTPHFYTTAGQGYPEPSPRDILIFNPVVRYVGDRVAAVAAETIEAAEAGVRALEVEYEELPAIFDPEESIDNPVVIHPEPGITFIHEQHRNIAAHIGVVLGDPEKGLKESKWVFEGKYKTPYVQQAHIEPHISLSWLDENDRLVIRTSTQVPFHVRRIVAEVNHIPISQVRVIKPRVGGGFGGKQ